VDEPESLGVAGDDDVSPGSEPIESRMLYSPQSLALMHWGLIKLGVKRQARVQKNIKSVFFKDLEKVSMQSLAVLLHSDLSLQKATLS